MDDLLLFSQSFEAQVRHVREIFQALRVARLRLQPSKCIMATDTTSCLGHIVSREGILPAPSKCEAMRNFPPPESLKEVRRFLGVTSYYRRFIRGYAVVAEPITRLLRKSASWSWAVPQQEAFDALILNLVSAPILAHFDETVELTVTTDASIYGLGAVLSQKKEKLSLWWHTLAGLSVIPKNVIIPTS